MPTFPELMRKPTPQRRIALAPILSPGRNSFPTLANCIAHSTGSAFDDVIGFHPLPHGGAQDLQRSEKGNDQHCEGKQLHESAARGLRGDAEPG